VTSRGIALCCSLLLLAACEGGDSNPKAHSSPGSQDTRLSTLPWITSIVDYAVVSPTVGWIHVRTNADVLARTTDGGRTWHAQLVADGLASNGSKMQWIDARNGVLIGQHRDVGVVWRTSDGGDTWRSFLVHPSPLVYPRHWINATGFFSSAMNGTVLFQADYCALYAFCPLVMPSDWLAYTTRDGGANWTLVGELPRLEPVGIQVDFVNADAGVAVSGSTVVATHDGGKTWSSFVLTSEPACSRRDCSIYSSKVTMFNETDGGIVSMVTGRATQLSRIAYTTSDGGKTWATVQRLLDGGEGVVEYVAGGVLVDIPSESMPEAGLHVAAMQATDAEHIWVATTTTARHGGFWGWDTHDGTYITMYATDNGGVTWRPLMLPTVPWSLKARVPDGLTE
jgi:hypothetical protein